MVKTISALTLRRVTARMANSVVALTFLAAYIVANAFVPLTSGTAFAATKNVDNEGAQVVAQGIEQEQEQNDKKSSKLPKEPHSTPEAGLEAGLANLEKNVKQQEKDDGVQQETTLPEQAKKALEQEQPSPDGLTTESDRANKQDDHKKDSAVTEEPKVTPEVKKAIVEDNDKTSQHDNKGKSQNETPRQVQYVPEPKKDSDERGDKLDGRKSEHKKDDKKPGEDRGGKKDECRDGEQGSPAFISSKIIGGQKDRDNCEPEHHDDDDECLDRGDQSLLGFRHISDREKDTRKDCDHEKAKDDDKDKIKVFVCKYVGTPWVNESLKEGKNPISVGVPKGQDRTPGTYFNDAHGSSYVLAYDTGQETPSIDECPAPRVPIEVTPTAPQQQVVCWANNDVITLPEVEGVTYTHTGWVEGSLTVTATANEHYYLPEGAQTEWTFTDENTPCAVTPVAPTVVVVCGANNDMITMPTVEGVTYATTGWVDGKNTITATAEEGYVLAEEATASWTFTDANTPCGNVLGDTTTTPSVTPVPVVATTATLADTGTDMTLVALLSSGLLGAAILTVMQNSKRGSKIMSQLRRMFDDMQRAFTAPFVLPIE